MKFTEDTNSTRRIEIETSMKKNRLEEQEKNQYFTQQKRKPRLKRRKKNISRSYS
jgi:hypothetical protein